MATKSVTAAAGAVSDYIQLALPLFKNGVSIICDVGGGITGTYKLEVSNDPPIAESSMNSFSSALAPLVTHWADHDEIVGKSADAASNIAYPVQWVRLNCTSVLTGSVTLSIAAGY